jgi:hypothetical protein
MTSPLPAKRMIKGYSGLAKRYDRNPRTPKRWNASGLLPPPDAVINNVPYWFEHTLDQHDRRTVAEALSQPREARQLPDHLSKLETQRTITSRDDLANDPSGPPPPENGTTSSKGRTPAATGAYGQDRTEQRRGVAARKSASS